MKNKYFFLLILFGLILVGIFFFVNKTSATITFYDTGAGYQVRVRSQDCVMNLSEAMYQASVAAGNNLIKKPVEGVYIFYNCTPYLGHTGQTVNCRMSDSGKIWFFVLQQESTSLDMINIRGSSSNKKYTNVTLENMTMIMNFSGDSFDGDMIDAGGNAYNTVKLDDCHLELRGCAGYITKNSVYSPIFINRTKIINGGFVTCKLFLNDVTLAFTDSSKYGMYMVSVGDVKNVVLKNVYHPTVHSVSQYNLSDVTFEGEYIATLFSIQYNDYMIDCTADNLGIRELMSDDGGKLHWTKTFRVNVLNSSGSPNVRIKVYNTDTSTLVYNFTCTGLSQVMYLDYCWWNSTIPHYCYNYTLNVTNVNNQMETFEFPFAIDMNQNHINWTLFLYKEKYSGDPLIVCNPNPANNSNNTISNENGITTSIDVFYLPAIVGTNLNVTLSSNSSGTWESYYTEEINSNGTVSFFNTNFTEKGVTYYWNVSVVNDTGYYVNKSYWFNTTPECPTCPVYNPLIISNPNPANGTHGTNFLQASPGGLTTALDVYCMNFTTETMKIENIVNPTANLSSYNVLTRGQTFNSTTGFVLTSLEVFAGVVSESHNVTFWISTCENTTGIEKPIASFQTDYISKKIQAVSSVGWNKITFDTPVWIESNKAYAFVLKGTSSANPKFGLNASGALYPKGNASVYNIGTWISTTSDFLFRINGTSFDNSLNITWLSNTSGSWKVYGKSIVVQNGTVSILNPNMTANNTQYWYNFSIEHQGVVVNNTIPVTFTTGTRIAYSQIYKDDLPLLISLSCMVALPLSTVLYTNRRNKK